jgi:hypothetical protein
VIAIALFKKVNERSVDRDSDRAVRAFAFSLRSYIRRRAAKAHHEASERADKDEFSQELVKSWFRLRVREHRRHSNSSKAPN